MGKHRVNRESETQDVEDTSSNDNRLDSMSKAIDELIRVVVQIRDSCTLGDQSSHTCGTKDHWHSLLKIFISLNPPHFQGNVDPIAAESWLSKICQTYDVIECPLERRVPLTALLLDGEADRWWHITSTRMQVTVMTWDDFQRLFRERHVPQSFRDLRQRNSMSCGRVTCLLHSMRRALWS